MIGDESGSHPYRVSSAGAGWGGSVRGRDVGVGRWLVDPGLCWSVSLTGAVWKGRPRSAVAMVADAVTWRESAPVREFGQHRSQNGHATGEDAWAAS